MLTLRDLQKHRMKVVRKTCLRKPRLERGVGLLSHITRRTRRFPCSDRTQLVDIDNALLRSQPFGSLAISYSRHCPIFFRSTTPLRAELELLTRSPAKYTPAPFENGKHEFVPAAW